MRSFEITNSTPTIDTEINRRCKGERDSAKVLWRWSWDLILGVLSPLPAPSSAPGSDPDYTGNMWPISLALPALTWLPTLQLWGESQIPPGGVSGSAGEAPAGPARASGDWSQRLDLWWKSEGIVSPSSSMSARMPQGAGQGTEVKAHADTSEDRTTLSLSFSIHRSKQPRRALSQLGTSGIPSHDSPHPSHNNAFPSQRWMGQGICKHA